MSPAPLPAAGMNGTKQQQVPTCRPWRSAGGIRRTRSPIQHHLAHDTMKARHTSISTIRWLWRLCWGMHETEAWHPVGDGGVVVTTILSSSPPPINTAVYPRYDLP